jgi:hypothetical protein
MSRDRINRLSRRVEALAQCASPKRRRVFKVVVDNHMKQGRRSPSIEPSMGSPTTTY